jgi:hypothetical protein
MASPLAGSLARTIAKAAGPLFLDAVLTREVVTLTEESESFDPPAPTTTTFACKAIVSQYGDGLRASGVVEAREVEVLILAKTLATMPQPLDRITVSGWPGPLMIVPTESSGKDVVTSDPAKATWSCRCAT